MRAAVATAETGFGTIAPMPTDQSAADAALFAETLATAVASVGVTLPTPAFDRLCEHYALLLELNRSLNLTRITAPRDAAVKHYADSLAVIAALPEMGVEVHRVLDVGTGAGFPAIPLAVARPGWQVVAIDSTGKKVRAVEEASRRLRLDNLSARHARCEDLDARGQPFDLVCIRAVAALDACIRMARPHLSRSGAIVCWKAAKIDDGELRRARRAADRASLGPPTSFHYAISGLDRARRHQLIWFRVV